MTLDAATQLRYAFQEAVAGRYSIERELGRGGMGIVYLARDVRLDRPVALKLLPPERAEVASIRERFLHEARMAARLSHPNIVPIHAVEEIGNFVFFAMQYVSGETLGDRLRRVQVLPPWDAARLLRDVAWALAYAHAQGVVHRDIKPDNILIDQEGRALVVDFGIAFQTTDTHAPGRIQGTPEYLSPEQAGGEPCDGRSDLYSLGAVAYHTLTGRPPFVGDASSLLAQHLTAQSPRLVDTATELPVRLASAVDRALQKDRDARWPDAETMAEAFAPPLPMTADLPVPVRIWAERGRELKGFYVVWSLLFYGLSTLVFTAAMNAGQWPLGAKVIFGFFLMAIPAPWMGHALWRLVETRRALEAGATVEELRHAVEVTRARREEEMRFDATRSVHWLPRLVRRVTYAGFVASLSVLIAGRVTGADFFNSAWFLMFVLPTLVVLGGDSWDLFSRAGGSGRWIRGHDCGHGSGGVRRVGSSHGLPPAASRSRPPPGPPGVPPKLHSAVPPKPSMRRSHQRSGRPSPTCPRSSPASSTKRPSPAHNWMAASRGHGPRASRRRSARSKRCGWGCCACMRIRRRWGHSPWISTRHASWRNGWIICRRERMRSNAS